jgi:broad specificity phosphatase PhoE
MFLTRHLYPNSFVILCLLKSSSYCDTTSSGKYVFKRINVDSDLKNDRTQSERRVKLIHFVRHGEGQHNVAARKNFDNTRYDITTFDAPLSTYGVTQCVDPKELNEKVSMNTKLVVVSPMRRTIQTATLSFPHLIGNIPWIAHENLRERCGIFPCNSRSTKLDLSRYFPHVDFSLITNDQDPLHEKFDDPKKITREPVEHVNQRAEEFLNWLAKRDEDEIIVVSHCGFLYCLFENVLKNQPITYLTNQSEIFETRDIKSYIIEFKNIN